MLGDVHGDLRHVLPIVKQVKPAAVIFLGDLELGRPFEEEVAEVMQLTEVYFIHGNHDTNTVTTHDYLFNSKLSDRNLHNKIVEIDGHRVAGLGGIFRQTIWWPKDDPEVKPKYENYDAFVEAEMQASLWQELRRQKKQGNAENSGEPVILNGKRLLHKSTIFYDDWMNLYGQQADILVTHEAPCCHPYGFAGITELAKGMQVKKTFHGHHHDRLDYSEHKGRLGFDAYGVGYRGISDQDGLPFKDGDYDQSRASRRPDLTLNLD